MGKEEVAHIEYDVEHDESQIEITLVNKNLPPHLWRRERLTIERELRKVGDLTLILVASKNDDDAESEPKQFYIEFEKGRNPTLEEVKAPQ